MAGQTAGRCSRHWPQPEKHHTVRAQCGTMTGPSQSDYTRKLATAGFVMGIAALAGQYIFFQPLFRQLGMGPIMSAFGMFMFFTVLTNSMLVAAYWSSLSDTPGRVVRFFRQTGVRTALAAHIALVAIVYITAIRGHVAMTMPMQVTDALLHYLAPAMYLAWWWRLPGKQAINYTDIPRWMAWPVLYLCFIMLAGLTTGAFIYPILDVTRLGAIIVAVNIVLILGLLAVLGAGLIFVAKLQSSKAKAPAK